MLKLEAKGLFDEYAKAPRANWTEWGEGGLQCKAGQLRVSRIPEEDSNGIDFRISNEFRIWQDFEEFYKEIWKEFGHEDFFLNSSRLLKDF
jgi:hypothetical protein